MVLMRPISFLFNDADVDRLSQLVAKAFEVSWTEREDFDRRDERAATKEQIGLGFGSFR